MSCRQTVCLPDLTFNVYAKSEPSDAPWACGTRLNVLTKGLSNQNINFGCEAPAVIPEVTNRQKGWCYCRSSTISSDMNSPSLHQEGVSPHRGLPVHLEPGEGESEVSTRSGWKHTHQKQMDSHFKLPHHVTGGRAVSSDYIPRTTSTTLTKQKHMILIQKHEDFSEITTSLFSG